MYRELITQENNLTVMCVNNCAKNEKNKHQ